MKVKWTLRLPALQLFSSRYLDIDSFYMLLAHFWLHDLLEMFKHFFENKDLVDNISEALLMLTTTLAASYECCDGRRAGV